MNNHKYFALEQAHEAGPATLYIYGDITSWEWLESDVSSYTLAHLLDTITASEIMVYINSYGGEVAEGLAIYNALRRKNCKVTTVCDGFACSAASVVFMAGTERIMNPASLLLIHNAWSSYTGNADALRKAADDLEIISNAAKQAYLSCVNIGEEELNALLADESWILPADAISMGFATAISTAAAEETPSQSCRNTVYQLITKAVKQAQPPEPPAEPEPEPTTPPADPEPAEPQAAGERAAGFVASAFQAFVDQRFSKVN